METTIMGYIGVLYLHIKGTRRVLVEPLLRPLLTAFAGRAPTPVRSGVQSPGFLHHQIAARLSIGLISGLYWDYIGIMEKKMEKG